MCIDFFFFFQAEDGIRDVAVTGVQTCALPISVPPRPEKPPHVEEFQISGEPAPAAAENTPAAAPPIPLDKPAAKTTAGKSKEKPAQKAPPKPAKPAEPELEREQEYELVLEQEQLVPAYDQQPPEPPAPARNKAAA